MIMIVMMMMMVMIMIMIMIVIMIVKIRWVILRGYSRCSLHPQDSATSTLVCILLYRLEVDNFTVVRCFW